MQAICALLVFQTPDLPVPLARLSPWLDWLVIPRETVFAELAAQRHRRFLKTHTPLDGLPLDPRVTYLVVARHPLDAAVSLYHQGANLHRERVRPPRLPLAEWLRGWIDGDADPRAALDSLPGVLWHLSDAWARRAAPNVALVHYDDLMDDLQGQMRRLAGLLDIAVPEDRWPELVAAAGFPAMRDRAAQLAPDPAGILKDPTAFFRRGRPGAARELLTAADLARYASRAAELALPDLLAWLHR